MQKKGSKLHLVTVVGDFHKDLTLVQMLKHYDSWVDQKTVVHYIVGDKLPAEIAQESLEFSEYLAKNGYVLDELRPRYDDDNLVVINLHKKGVDGFMGKQTWIYNLKSEKLSSSVN